MAELIAALDVQTRAEAVEKVTLNSVLTTTLQWKVSLRFRASLMLQLPKKKNQQSQSL